MLAKVPNCAVENGSLKSTPMLALAGGSPSCMLTFAAAVEARLTCEAARAPTPGTIPGRGGSGPGGVTDGGDPLGLPG
eukprot:CAMPEP_0175411802 /NCGR_PEP_ID=MMETSP0095-20121207/42311_1 /TAXON_ID=311494 /ORGANISM="Alexandrium monilatum, Strain CCMP3105" /LENGTH=77 /DNA_ID=CAMNT_0016710793 /DNA_START=60 /DNA_END=290 /DNA_ORIENTATION=-